MLFPGDTGWANDFEGRDLTRIVDTITPLKGASGLIYRMRVTDDHHELPRTPGIFFCAWPIPYPGAPVQPVYWGSATENLAEQVRQDEGFIGAARSGATCFGYLEIKSRRAQKRALIDLGALAHHSEVAAPVTPRSRYTRWA
jgi:hypothetical protein